MITIHDLSMRFGRFTAVDGVSLEIPAGDSVALWGVNGAGKTTIIRCALGLLRYRGRITVGGLDARRQGKRVRRMIGYVPQELGFYDDLRVGEAVRFFSRLRGLPARETAGVLGHVGLEGHERKRMRELSGGMKQRLALAIAMLGDPPVLVLDEVTASLDACGRESFIRLLGSLASGGKTLLFASHRPDEIQALARRVVRLERGVVTAIEPAAGFSESPQTRPAGEALHLHMAPDARAGAVALLRTHGFAAVLNGVGIVVPTAGRARVAPLRILAEARIGVHDFEMIAGHEPASIGEIRP